MKKNDKADIIIHIWLAAAWACSTPFRSLVCAGIAFLVIATKVFLIKPEQ